MIELYHHGILGQKWGKKNGPPYPLSRTGDWSSAERRQQKKNYKVLKKTYAQNEQLAKAVASKRIVAENVKTPRFVKELYDSLNKGDVEKYYKSMLDYTNAWDNSHNAMVNYTASHPFRSKEELKKFSDDFNKFIKSKEYKKLDKLRQTAHINLDNASYNLDKNIRKKISLWVK